MHLKSPGNLDYNWQSIIYFRKISINNLLFFKLKLHLRQVTAKLEVYVLDT